MSTLLWVALGALLGAIVAVALVVWLFSVAGEQIVALMRQLIDSK